MSIHQNIEIDITLLTRYLAGEATPEEAMAIDDWLANGSNNAAFERLQKAWQLVPGNRIYQVPAPDTEWSKLEAILPEEKKVPAVRRLIIRYAAAALVAGVLLTAGWYGYRQMGKENSPVWHQLLTAQTPGDKGKGVLPDGSSVVVNRNSRLQYTADYNQRDRKVQLQGEGFFDVTADKDKPFIVQAGALQIQVLGTSFNVNDDSLKNKIAVSVTTGKVKLYTADKALVVAAGQTGIYEKATGTMTIGKTADENIFSYVTHDFSFEDMPLPDICRHLEHTFDVKIVLDHPQLSQCRMSAHFKDRSVTYIMDIIAATLNVQYTMQDTTIHINGNGCN